jgi:hypothetical protein
VRRRHALRLDGAGLFGLLTTSAGCTALSGAATAPTRFDDDTRSAVRSEIRTALEDGPFSRDIEVVLPDTGEANDPWLREVFVDEGSDRVTATTVTPPSRDWDHPVVTARPSGRSLQALERQDRQAESSMPFLHSASS